MSIALITRSVLIGLGALAFQGCAAITHYNYKRDIMSGAGSAVFADAKQRAVITSQNPKDAIKVLMKLRDDAIKQADISQGHAASAVDPLNADAHRKNQLYYTQFADKVMKKILSGNFASRDLRVIRTCAEPSPDALSALAASGGIAAEVFGKGKGQLQAAVAESAGSIGLRTQSIQLMRDAMFRLCEGYMNDALGNAAFETLHRRFQNSMVAILAIEQLTGVVRAPAITLASTSAVGAADAVADLTQKTLDASKQAQSTKAAADLAAKNTQAQLTKRDNAQQAVADQKAVIKDKGDKQAASLRDAKGDLIAGATPKPPDAEIQAEREALTPLESTLATEQSELNKLEAEQKSKEADASQAEQTHQYMKEALDAARFGRATASTSAFYENLGKPYQPSEKAMKYVSRSVTDIVQSFFDESYIDEVCTTLFTSAADGELAQLAMEEFKRQISFEYKKNAGDEVSDTTSVFEICKRHIAEDAKNSEELANEKLSIASSKLKDVKLQNAQIDAAQEKIDADKRQITKEEGTLQNRKNTLDREKGEITRAQERLNINQTKLDEKNSQLDEKKQNLLTLENNLETISEFAKKGVEISSLIQAVCGEEGMEGMQKTIASLVVDEGERERICKSLKYNLEYDELKKITKNLEVEFKGVEEALMTVDDNK